MASGKGWAKSLLRVAGITIAVAGAGLPNVASAETAQGLFRMPAIGSTETVDHTSWDRQLKAFVQPGPDGLNRVDYMALKKDGRQTLEAYLRRLEQVDPRRLDRAEQFAFLANLYNAKTVEIVVARYPVKSILEISLGGGLVAAISGGPWKAKVLKVGGIELSLDDIEHAILRPIFKDPRVHYALNCASVSCPNLRTEAFTGARLNEQLEAAAHAYVNSPRGVRLDAGRLIFSSIYVWYRADFGDSDQGVLQHLRQYAGPALGQELTRVTSIADHAYDWGLNDAIR